MSKLDFEKYQQLFRKAKFDEAFVALEGLRSELEPGLFSYNMALLNQKMNKLEMSRYHYENALAHGLGSLKVYKNLELVKNELGVTALEKSESVDDYLYSSNFLTNIEYLGIIGFMILLTSIFLYKKMNKFFLISLNALIVLYIAGIFFLNQNKIKVISLEEINIYHGPSKIFEVIQTTPPGMKIIVEDSNEKWIKVIIPSRFSGWIENKGFKKL